MNDILEILIPVAPAVVVGLLAYYFFDGFLKNEKNRRRFLMHKEAQAASLPIRLQAYERLTLLLERISPLQLLIRVKPTTEDKKAYVDLLAATIEQEFEHNLTQQVYVSNECWATVKSSKNTLRISNSRRNQHLKVVKLITLMSSDARRTQCHILRWQYCREGD